MTVTKFRNYFLMFLLIATSGIQFFYFNEQWLVIGVVIAFLIAVYKGIINKIDTSFIFIILTFILWEAIQNFLMGVYSLRPLLGTFSRILFAYFAIKILNKHFIEYFLKWMKIFIHISLSFYLLFYIAPDLIRWLFTNTQDVFYPIFGYESAVYNVRPNIILFNFHGFELNPMRNSGPFWEPGAFAVYLIIAIVLIIFQDSKLNYKKIFIYILTLFTTLSTSGIFVLFFVILYASYFSNQKKIFNYLITPFLIYTFFLAAGSLDFLLPKLQHNISVAEETTASRFGSALADWNLYVRNPILGYGRNLEIAYEQLNIDNISLHRNNGLTKIFVQWGILAVLYLYFIFKSFKYLKTKIFKSVYSPWFPFLAILMLGFSQNIFRFSFFYGLMLWQYINITLPKHEK